MNILSFAGIADWYVARTKYGKLFKAMVGEFEGVRILSQDRQKAWEEEKLREALRYASAAPFYMSRVGEQSSSLSSFDFTTKGEYRELVRLFRSAEYRGAVRTIRTSGTTGAGLAVNTTPLHTAALAASWWVFRNRFGVEYGEKGIVFGGRRVVGNPAGSGNLWLTLTHTNQILASSYHISRETIPSYINMIKSSGASWIHGYPSALLQIAAFILDAGIELKCDLKLVSTGSESISSSQRDMLSRAFSAPVSEYYGQVEGVCSLWRCEYGSLHNQGIVGNLELLPLPDRPGYAEIVGTGYWNFANPLIRYRTGDILELRSESCPCGRPGAIGNEIEGRIDDYVITRDGRRVGRLARVFTLVNGVSTTQLVQKRVGQFELHVLRGERLSFSGDFPTELSRMLNEPVELKVVEVDSFERTRNGKVRSVLRRIEAD